MHTCLFFGFFVFFVCVCFFLGDFRGRRCNRKLAYGARNTQALLYRKNCYCYLYYYYCCYCYWCCYWCCCFVFFVSEWTRHTHSLSTTNRRTITHHFFSHTNGKNAYAYTFTTMHMHMHGKKCPTNTNTIKNVLFQLNSLFLCLFTTPAIFFSNSDILVLLLYLLTSFLSISDAGR